MGASRKVQLEDTEGNEEAETGQAVMVAANTHRLCLPARLGASGTMNFPACKFIRGPVARHRLFL